MKNIRQSRSSIYSEDGGACDDGHGQCCYDNRDGSGGDV